MAKRRVTKSRASTKDRVEYIARKAQAEFKARDADWNTYAEGTNMRLDRIEAFLSLPWYRRWFSRLEIE